MMNLLLSISQAVPDSTARMVDPVTHAVDAPVPLSPEAAKETFAVARWIMEFVYAIMKGLGIPDSADAVMVGYIIVILALSFAIGWLVRWIVMAIVHRVERHYPNNEVLNYLRQTRFFKKACRIIPALVFLIFVEFTCLEWPRLGVWMSRIAWIYVVLVITIALCSLVGVVWMRINSRDNKKKLPLHGLVQLVKGILWFLSVIVMVAILLDKSPAVLLTGLGAFAAVLMLVFKDSILGVVAGVQLSENDSVHVGDWISVGSDIQGVVQEVSLTNIKILNFDKTVTNVPPYSLVSGNFTNHTAMVLTQTRRICRSFMVDADSVVPTDDALLDEFEKLPLVGDWVAKKRAQKSAGQTIDVANPEGLVDGTIETNLGVFRAYLTLWLQQNPLIDKQSTYFVTTLAQTAYGIPLQIYAFTTTSDWIAYEHIQAGVFEHLAVMMPQFRLYLYESASGRDTVLDGYLPGHKIDGILGIPYPLYPGVSTPENPGAAH